jgi:hypothetical protein
MVFRDPTGRRRRALRTTVLALSLVLVLLVALIVVGLRDLHPPSAAVLAGAPRRDEIGTPAGASVKPYPKPTIQSVTPTVSAPPRRSARTGPPVRPRRSASRPPYRPRPYTAPPVSPQPSVSPTPRRSDPPPAPTPHPSAPPSVSRTLYAFRWGKTDGWRSGANVGTVATVTSFADGPGRPYGGKYALDGSPSDGAVIPKPRTMSVVPRVPLDLSAAQTFFLHVDGFGYAPYATGYKVRVTLASGSRKLTRTVRVKCNVWNRVSFGVSSWRYRRRVTSISVSYIGIGSNTPWYPHFQIDDVGYRT